MTNRFRPKYRELSVDEGAVVEGIKVNAENLEAAIEAAPNSRYTALALAALEEAVMWAVKAATAGPG